MLTHRVDDDMEKSNCSTGILSVLFHIKHFFRHNGGIKLISLSVLKSCLDRGSLVQEHQTKDWLRNHLKSPIFKAQKFLKAEVVGVETHFSNESVDDFWVGFKGHPIIVLIVHGMERFANQYYIQKCKLMSNSYLIIFGQQHSGHSHHYNLIMHSQIIQEEECFVEADKESLRDSRISRNSISVDIAPIKHYIPQPNQLHTHSRPIQYNPRVFSTEGFIERLPDALNQPCIEMQSPNKNKAIRIKLGNKQKMRLDKFLASKDLKIIYDKSTDRNINNISKEDFSDKKKNQGAETLRLRKLHSTTDFNGKYYKQLLAYSERRDKKTPYDLIDSNFECGNLSKVYTSKQSENIHYLLLEQDVNTHGYTNWFFFRVKANQPGRRRFFILNMGKKTQFYKQNMKISIFSMKKYKEQQVRWFKGGQNISFFQTDFEKNPDTGIFYFCLYFEYQFVQGEEAYFALCQPYSYSRLANLVKQLKRDKQKYEGEGKIIKINPIGYSLCNNIIPSISITLNTNIEGPAKKKVVILGRQHPCQVAGSFISQLMIKRLLCGQTPDIKFLLTNYEVVFIPMVNPDGVIYGNARCNIAGFDLNRQWGQYMIKQFTPETFKIRNYLQILKKGEESQGKPNIRFILDLHGHGKKLNSFLFCCKNDDRFSHRIFPLIMSKLEKRFDLLSCTYGITRDKECSLRGQLYQMGIRNCFTLENSYYGYFLQNKTKQTSENKGKQKVSTIKEVQGYTELDYEQIANGVMKSFHIYLASPQNSDKNEILNTYGFNYETIYEQLTKIIDRLERQEKFLYNEKEALSDSDPEGDILRLDERLKIYGNQKNKKLDQKIKEVFQKSKKSEKRKQKPNKQPQVKTEPEKDLSSDTSSVKIDNQSERRLEQKLLITQQFVKNNPKNITKSKFTVQRKSTLLIQKLQVQLDQTVEKKTLNNSYHVNLSQVPKKRPERRLSSSAFNKESGKKFNRARMYSKVKTEISDNHSYSAGEIQDQSQRKQEIQKSYGKLKDQSLKTMIKESLFFMGTSQRNKKCLWVQGIKNQDSKNRISKRSNISISQSNSHSLRNSDYLELEVNGTNKERFFLQKQITKNDIRPAANKSNEIRPSKSNFSQKNYQRFKSFMKNKSLKKHDAQMKSSVFYHYPVL